MFSHPSFGHRADTSLRTRELLTITQFHQSLQLIVAEELFPTTTFLLVLCLLNHSIRTFREQIKELRCSVQADVGLDILEVLLKDKNIELHSSTAMGIHGLHHTSIVDKEGIDQQAEACSDERNLFL